ncbi:MAG: Ig-like domain-containing protein [Fimbriimonadales bacterium]|nr:Ig-like domain-containing protein [Fimbriimonadales bacterium]
MRSLRVFVVGIVLVGGPFVWGTGTIRLGAYPTISVADGRSTVTLSAELRTSGGERASDGTVVRFVTTLGYFREADIRTSAGTARAVLVAPNSPGVATVSASAPGFAPTTIEVEFVKDRASLASATQYVEISCPEYLAYHPDIRIVSATGSPRKASVQYRDVRIVADDMQVNLSTLGVVAMNAVLRVGDEEVNCLRLRYDLSRREGTAITRLEGVGGFYGLKRARVVPLEREARANEFGFEDVGVSATSVHAERILAVPNREIQFHQARLYVGNTKVLSMPLYAMKPNTEPGSLGDSVISFMDGGVVVDYPYYLRLSPNDRSLVRVRAGQSYGRGVSNSRGLFLDWENHYFRGNQMEGSVTLMGLGRSDMGLSWRHTHRIDERSTAYAYLDFPGFRSVFGSLSASRAFDGFTVSLSGNSTRAFRGTPSETQRLDINVETPLKPLSPGVPVNYTLGLTANMSRTRFGSFQNSQEGFGVRGRFIMRPLPLWSGANLMASLTVSQLWGKNTGNAPGLLGSVTVTTPLEKGTLSLSYDYHRDPFVASFMGTHRVNALYNLNTRPLYLSLLAAKSLDIDSATLYVDAFYELSPLWRLGTQFSYDRFSGTLYRDETFVLGYTLGFRELRLTYSRSTHKFGFELVNAPFR